MDYCVYALLDPETEEIRYIGKTVAALHTRLSQHIYAAKSNKWKSHVNTWIRSVLNRGLRPIAKPLTFVDDKEILSQEEIRLIAYYKKRGARLTNLTDGGDGAPGRILSEASRKKMSESHKGQPGHWTGKKRDAETCRKISESNKGKKAWNKGIPMSEDQKAKISSSRKGKSMGNQNAKGGPGNPTSPSEETRRKIAQSLAGRKVPDEVRARIAESMRQYRAKLAESQNV